MPEPDVDPNLASVKRTALYALGAGVAIALFKFGIYWLTDSVAVLSDALETLINIVAAGGMLYTIWYSNQPADRRHPYGHGKIEFLAVGLEGWLILIAGLVIVWQAIDRLIQQQMPHNLNYGIWLLAGVGVLDAVLAGYVWRAGRKYAHDVLKADGRHLITDVLSTVGVVIGLILVQWSNQYWLDPLVAIIMAALILGMSWRLLWQSFHGLMDSTDPKDEQAINEILDDEVARGHIHGYHKARHRHTGPFHWIDMHLQVDGNMTVAQGHDLASRIEGRIEERLGRANATAHLEPYDPQRHPPAGLSSDDLQQRADMAAQLLSDDAPRATSSSEQTDRDAPPPPLDHPELADERDPDAQFEADEPDESKRAAPPAQEDSAQGGQQEEAQQEEAQQEQDDGSETYELNEPDADETDQRRGDRDDPPPDDPHRNA